MKVRHLQQRDWDQLLMVATGYLPLTNGDLREAMMRAIAAHADLIAGVRGGGISTELPKGTVTLFVPDDGGLALAFERRSEGADDDDDYEDLGPPDVTLEVLDRSGSYTGSPNEDAGAADDPDSWPEVG